MLRGTVLVTCLGLGMIVETFDPANDADIARVSVRGSDLVVEAHKIHAHSFLAEYDFKLILKAGTEELDSIDMSPDTGGYSRIDVLRIDGSTIAFRDRAKTECLNIAQEKFETCNFTSAGTRVGYFDFDSKKNWRFIRRDGRRN